MLMDSNVFLYDRRQSVLRNMRITANASQTQIRTVPAVSRKHIRLELKPPYATTMRRRRRLSWKKI